MKTTTPISAIALLLLFLINTLSPVSAYFFDRVDQNWQILTTPLSVEFSAVSINETSCTPTESLCLGGTLTRNQAITIKATVDNLAASALTFRITGQLFWQDEARERGELFLYPSGYTTAMINDDINTGSNNALFGLNQQDQTLLVNQTPLVGFEALVTPTIVLAAQASVDFEFVLFYLHQGGIGAEQTTRFANFNLLGEVENGQTWSLQTAKQLRWEDGPRPEITATSLPRTAFQLESSNLVLNQFVTASDWFDGDITNKVTYTSNPTFNPDRAGTYLITYSVTNSLGQKADPLTLDVTIWNFSKLVTGFYHSLALTSHGQVYTWGYNRSGQLGLDSTIESVNQPRLITAFKDQKVIDIAVSLESSYALTDKGAVYAWGSNSFGQLGDGTETDRIKPTAVYLPGNAKLVSLTAGTYSVGGLTADNQAYGWGYALPLHGEYDYYNYPTKLKLPALSQFAFGASSGGGITTSGALMTWGSNESGQLGPNHPDNELPATISYFAQRGIALTQLSFGNQHALALTATGQVYAWGQGSYGQLGNGLKSDSTTPVLVSLSDPCKQVIAAYNHSVVVTTSGMAYAFGDNAYGQAGLGSVSNRSTPGLIGPPGVVSASANYANTFLLRDGVVVYGAGVGAVGALGTGKSNSTNTPVTWRFLP